VKRLPLEQELLRALRNGPESTLDELAEAVGLPRTNYGRSLSNHVRGPVHQLVTRGLVEEHGRRYRLSKRGRRAIADGALNSPPGRDHRNDDKSVRGRPIPDR
jgi:predicted transcriptional regulator